MCLTPRSIASAMPYYYTLPLCFRARYYARDYALELDTMLDTMLLQLETARDYFIPYGLQRPYYYYLDRRLLSMATSILV